MATRVLHELGGGVEPHRLAVDERRGERRLQLRVAQLRDGIVQAALLVEREQPAPA